MSLSPLLYLKPFYPFLCNIMTAHRFKVKISRCSSYTNCQFAFMPWHNFKIFIVRAPLAVSWLCNHLKYSSFPRHCFLACGWKFLQKLPALSLPPFFSSICSRQNSLCIKLKLNSNNIMPRELETIFILFTRSFHIHPLAFNILFLHSWQTNLLRHRRAV